MVGVVAKASDVTLATNRECRDAVLLGLGDGHAGCLFGHDETKTPMAVNHCGGGRFADNLEWRARDDVATVDALAVFGDVDNAVGVMAAQVGLDLVGGHDLGLISGRPLGLVDGGRCLVQIFGSEGWHGTASVA